MNLGSAMARAKQHDKDAFCELVRLHEGMIRGIRPVWCMIGCTNIHPNSVKPTPAQVRSEVWTALVYGANGVGYFCHSLAPSYEMALLLKDKAMFAAATLKSYGVHLYKVSALSQTASQ
jgi:hypothetical protein